VKEQLDERLGQGLARWVVGVAGRASPTCWLVLLATVPLGLYAAFGLGINSDSVSLVSRELPAFRNHDRFASLFPNLENAMLVVIDAGSPELAREAADDLGSALRVRTDCFEDVYLPGGGDFFERNGLLYRSVDEVEQFADQIAGVQPILAELERDPSVANLTSLARKGLTRARLDGADAERWSEVLDRVGQATIRVYDEYPLAISWEEILLRGSAIETSTRRVLIAHPILDFGHVLAAARPLAAVREAAASLGLDPTHGVRVRVTGNPVLNYEEMIGLAWDIGAGSLFCFVLVTLLIHRALRSLRMTIAAIVTLLVGLVWTAAFATASVGELNVISMAFAILFIGLGVDFCIHLGMRYAELLREGLDGTAALGEATRSVGSSLVICAGTTAIGFFVFVPTSYRGVSELGMIAGGGMLIILFLTLTFFPALLSSWLRLDPGRDLSSVVVWRRGLFHFLERHPGPVRWAALGAGLAALLLLPGARFDPNIVAMRDPSTESVQTFDELLSAAGMASPWYIDVLAPDLPSARELVKKLDELPVVETAITIENYVPEDQEEKLAILEDVAFMLDPAAPVEGRYEEPPSVDEQVAALRDLHDFLENPGIDQTDNVLAGSMRALRGQLDTFLARVESDGDAPRALATLEQVLLASFPQQIARLRRAVSPEPVTRDKLPPELVSRMVASDGEIRIQVFPRSTLQDDATLRAFTGSVAAVAPDATGIAVNLIAFGDACQDAFKQALVSAIVVITLLLLVLWRSVRDTLLALAPLLLAAGCTVGAMVLTGIAFNFVNLIVIPLLFGIGVDSGIHLVHRAKSLEWGSEDLLGTSTARAVLFSALTTTVSFGSLALSSHRGMQSLGVLLIFGMTITVISNLVVLPALLERWRSRPAEPTSGSGRG